MGASQLNLTDFINPEVLKREQSLASGFQQARPFRHIMIDDFFTPDFCRRLCEQFPAFEERYALNENKIVGHKATREKVKSLGEAYVDADSLIQAPEFLAMVGRITGIDDLQYDPFYFGGGTHENLEGQDLDAHIDFNYHPVSNQHRRLNLIVYLNPEWDDSWGGSLQMHRDPYLEPAHDEIVTLTPLMNRCVIFETNEKSWHGFERITLPDDHKDLSRKSFAVYFYTDLRPAEELADEHSTVYVERHLPERYAPGMTLGEGDILEIKNFLVRRDQHLKRLYQDIRRLSSEISQLRQAGAGRPIELDDEIPAELGDAVRKIQLLRGRINDLETSTSWRLTAPVRALKRLVTGSS